MPALESIIQVSIADVLEVRGGPLREIEIWSVLCQSCTALQDIFLKGEARIEDGPSFIITPNTLLLCPNGHIQFAENFDMSEPRNKPYIPPEVMARLTTSSDAAIEKMYIYSLGMTLYWSAEYNTGHSSELSKNLDSLLLAMCEESVATRMALIHLLEACTLHAQRIYSGLPYSHHIIKLSKIVFGSLEELEKLALNSGMEEEYPYEGPSHQDYYSPEKKRKASLGMKRPRSGRSSHGYDEMDAAKFSRHSLSHYSSSTLTRDSYEDYSYSPSHSRYPHGSFQHRSLPVNSQRYSASCRSGRSYIEDTPAGRSYHLSDIHTLTPPQSSAYGADRTPRHSPRARSAYDRLKARRERLSALRGRLAIPAHYHSDENGREDDNEPAENKYKSLTSLASSAVQGSYHPDQYAEDFVPTATSIPSSHLEDPNDDILNDGGEHREAGGWKQQQIQQRTNIKRNKNRSNKDPNKSSHPLEDLGQQKSGTRLKLKKFFGPEFVVMSNEANVFLDMPPSIISTGKIGNIKGVEDRKKVTVILLNGQRLDLMCDGNTLGRELFDMVISHMMLSEHHYFGLTYIRDGEYLFMDPEQKLYKIAPDYWKTRNNNKKSFGFISMAPVTLFFRVKYFVENINYLRHQLTRHQYYLQLRRDILEERTHSDEEVAALQLASLALQAEMGDYDADVSGQNYFLPEHYLPASMIERMGMTSIRQQLPTMHSAHYGMTDMQAELEFLMEARKLPEYGIHFYRVMREKNNAHTSTWLGLCTRGIIVYLLSAGQRTPKQRYAWHLTKKIAFNKKRFYIESNDTSIKKFVHYTENYKKGKYLLQMCTSQHKFHLAMKSRASGSQNKYTQGFGGETDSALYSVEDSSSFGHIDDGGAGNDNDQDEYSDEYEVDEENMMDDNDNQYLSVPTTRDSSSYHRSPAINSEDQIMAGGEKEDFGLDRDSKYFTKYQKDQPVLIIDTRGDSGGSSSGSPSPDEHHLFGSEEALYSVQSPLEQQPEQPFSSPSDEENVLIVTLEKIDPIVGVGKTKCTFA